MTCSSCFMGNPYTPFRDQDAGLKRSLGFSGNCIVALFTLKNMTDQYRQSGST